MSELGGLLNSFIISGKVVVSFGLEALMYSAVLKEIFVVAGKAKPKKKAKISKKSNLRNTEKRENASNQS